MFRRISQTTHNQENVITQGHYPAPTTPRRNELHQQTKYFCNHLDKLHRDLKPDNILLDENEELKIADFGLARDVEVMMTKGACTPLYAAPEVLKLEQYDQKCDVWSAGLILYEMLMGKEMFAHVKTKGQLLQEIEKFKSPNKRIDYPKELHPAW